MPITVRRRRMGRAKIPINPHRHLQDQRVHEALCNNHINFPYVLNLGFAGVLA